MVYFYLRISSTVYFSDFIMSFDPFAYIYWETKSTFSNGPQKKSAYIVYVPRKLLDKL